MSDVVARRWASSGYVPGRFGLWGFRGPFLVVEVSGPQVTVRLRPNFLARVLGAAPLVAGPDSSLTITTARVRAAWWWFIEFQLPGERQYSFEATTATRDTILLCLAEAGFKVPTQTQGS